MDFSGLDFSPGLSLQLSIRNRLGSSVSFSKDGRHREFFLVASFSRSRLRLSEEVAGIYLQSCLGGNALDFKVYQLYSWGFKFSVASKDVGFHIYNLKSFACKSFEVFFSLWAMEEQTGKENLNCGLRNKIKNGLK